MKISNIIKKKDIEYEVIYKRRKTLSIKVEAPNKVIIIAPTGVKTNILEKILESKKGWILDKLRDLKNIDRRYFNRDYIDGDKFLYLGKEYVLKIIMDSFLINPIIRIDGNILYIKTPYKDKDFIKKHLEKWYREKCKEKILERVNYYKKFIGKDFNNIRIKEQKKRWGSCSSKGNLNFNWRCVMAPKAVIDYIVVHEMCHLVHMDHSERFWNLVESILPDYTEKREWLIENGVKMNIG